MPTAFMPDRSFAKLLRKLVSDALPLLPPIAFTRFEKLLCSEATADPELLAVPVVLPIRSCSAELSGPPPEPPVVEPVLAVELLSVVELAAVGEVAAVVEAAAVVADAVVPVAVPVACDCNAATRF